MDELPAVKTTAACHPQRMQEKKHWNPRSTMRRCGFYSTRQRGQRPYPGSRIQTPISARDWLNTTVLSPSSGCRRASSCRIARDSFDILDSRYETGFSPGPHGRQLFCVASNVSCKVPHMVCLMDRLQWSIGVEGGGTIEQALDWCEIVNHEGSREPESLGSRSLAIFKTRSFRQGRG